MPPRIALRPSRLLSSPVLRPTTLSPRRALDNSRTFLDFPSPPEQVLTATRTLPYTRTRLYDLIADVDSYARFVPYCTSSRVTRWSAPDPDSGRRWPAQADLRVGFGGLEETFTSRLRCVPGSVVEAVSGAPVAVDGSSSPGDSGSGSVFKSLVTKWAFEPSGRHDTGTEVRLSIRFRFQNPLYAAMSAAVSDKVAATMIEAFEKEAARVLGPPETLSTQEASQ